MFESFCPNQAREWTKMYAKKCSSDKRSELCLKVVCRKDKQYDQCASPLSSRFAGLAKH